VILEMMKMDKANGKSLNYYFWRDSNHNEIDLIIPDGKNLICIEMKASQTVRSEHLKALHYLDDLVEGYSIKHYLVNFFNESQKRSRETIVSWNDLSQLISLPFVTCI
jgi:predicted AAA+ superfamily ATPase